MNDERCYICRRTLDEVKEAMGEVLKRYDEANDPQYQNVMGARKAIDEINYLIRTNNFAALRQYELAGMAVSKEILEKYGSWTSKKYQSALECDYPFSNNEKESLETIFSNMNNVKAGIVRTDKTIEEFYTEAKTKYEEVVRVSNQPIDETHASVKSSHSGIDVEMKHVQFGTMSVNEPRYNFAHEKIGDTSQKPVSIPICSVCNGIIDIKISNATRYL